MKRKKFITNSLFAGVAVTVPTSTMNEKPKGLEISYAAAFRHVENISLKSVRIKWDHATGLWEKENM